MAATVRASQTTLVASGASITAVLPTHVSGDLLLVWVWGYTSFTTPSGWTEQTAAGGSRLGPNGSTTVLTKLFTKTAASSSETNPASTMGATDQCGALAVSVQNADTASPIDGTPATSNGNNTSPSCPTTSPSGSDSLLFRTVGVWPGTGGGTFTWPTSTEIADFGGSTWDSYSVATKALVASGATGIESPTSTAAQAYSWIGTSVAIKSSGSAPAPVTYVGASTAWSAGSTSVTPAMASGWAATNLLVTVIHCKPTATGTPPTINTPTGWTQVQAATQLGTAAQGVDAGAVWQAVYTRTAVAGDTAPAYTVTNGNVSLALMLAFAKPSANTWDAATTTSGADTSSDTSMSVTGAANLSIANGDMVAVLSGPAGNTAQSAGAISATGATIGTVSETVEGDTVTGNDLAASCWHATVTAGTSSAAPVFTATLVTARMAGATFIRIRSTVPGTERTVTDLLGLTDSVEITITKSLTDLLGLLDSRSVEQANYREPVDLLGLSDSTSVNVTQDLIDLLGLVDSVELTTGRTITDVLGLLDDVTVVISAERAVTDLLGLTDNQNLTVDHTITDGLNLTDFVLAGREFIITLTDLVGLVDSTTLGLDRTITDLLGLVDSVSFNRDQTQTDVLGSSDSVEVYTTRTLTDLLGLLDSATASIVTLAVVTDGLGLTDSVILSSEKVVTSLLGLLDSTEQVIAAQVTVTDNLSLTDLATHSMSGVIERTITDLVGLVDSLDLTRFHTITDLLGIIDPGSTVSTGQDLTDVLSSVDSTSLTVDRTVTDFLGLLDTVLTSGSGFTSVVLTDNLGILDGVLTAGSFARTITDTLGLTDLAFVEDITQVILTDTVGITDSVIGLRYTDVILTDLLGLVDAVELTRAVMVTDALETLDDVARQVTVIRVLTDVNTLTDSVVVILQGNSAVFVWRGSSWDDAEVKVWNGSSWVAAEVNVRGATW